MNSTNKKQYFLILANFRARYVILLLFAGVFLFPKIAYLSTITPEKIIELTNQERIKKNEKPLTANQHLSQAAYNKAEAIFTKQRFEHNFGDRRFSAWVRDVNYKYRYVGENLAIDFVTSEGVMKALVNSPTHYENIVNEKFSEIGVAVVEDIFEGEKSILVVQIFGTPLENNLALDTNEKNISKNNENKKIAINNISYLTNANQDDLNLPTNNKIFLNLGTKDKLIYTDTNQDNNKYSDIFFTLAGFVYLGIFKIVNLKNIGL